MKTFTRGLVALLAVALGVAACGRHGADGSHTASTTAKPAASAIEAVKPDTPAAPTGSGHAVVLADESDTPGEASAALSPIATAVAANTPATAAQVPAKWVEGKHYQTLLPAQPTGSPAGKVEVVEVFWYGCGHCFHLDPSLESWRHGPKPAYIDFVRVPVMWNDTTRAHARLFYTIESLGKLEQLHSAIFREIHVNGNFLAAQDPADTERLQRTFLRANGVSDADFDKAYRSFSVESNLQRAQQLTQRYKVAGVPFLVVNGKYTTDVGMANSSEPDLIQLIGDLAAAERKH